MTGTLVLTPTKERIDWDTEAPEGSELDPRNAERRFSEMMADGGGFAFAQAADGTREQIRSFDPETQEKVTVVPQIAGG